MAGWGKNHIILPRTAGGMFIPIPAIERFRAKCRFEPETGCVIWEGSKSWGRGKNIRYGGFRDGKTIWLAHRWSAKHIHGFDIDGLQVDHCCPNIPIPNTLCVEHVRPLSSEQNRWLQTERRRQYVHMQVGLLPYEDIYGFAETDDDLIPFYDPPAWLVTQLATCAT